MAKWQNRDKKITKRRTIKEQHKFFRESKVDKSKSNKMVMKEKQRQQDRQNEDDGEAPS